MSPDFRIVVCPDDNLPDDPEAVQAEENTAENMEISSEPQTESVQVSEEEQPEKVRELSNEEVTEHTASLWKYLPVPDEPEPAPEYLNTEVRYPESSVIAARVRGKKHKHEGTNCDDWYETANYGNITFAAVADGAGSKVLSRIGARESCRAAVKYLTESFEQIFEYDPGIAEALSAELSDPKCMEVCGMLAGAVQQAVIRAYEAVEEAYSERAGSERFSELLGRSPELKDLSATLLIAAAVPIGTDGKERLFITCQIGDGMIALIDTKGGFEGSVKLMGIPDSGDFSGETDFLTSPRMKNIESLQLRTKLSRNKADTLLLMTDGVADDYFPNETQMHRLYFDLAVNGILDIPFEEKLSGSFDPQALTPEQLKLFKRIPDPQAYPWVNDPNVKIPIQYTKRICESMGLSFEDIWNDASVLRLAQLELRDFTSSDRSERLKIWLDNYVERGSFDDRTLVIVRM